MSEHGRTTPHEVAHGTGGHGQEAHAHEAHASDATYWKIAVILTVITAVEVWTYYATFLRPLLVPIILTLGAVKFAIVAAFYMHLKYDSRIFSGFFVFGLLVAAATVVSLIALFKGLW
jgi:cytochrome c oxidase subunit IV